MRRPVLFVTAWSASLVAAAALLARWTPPVETLRAALAVEPLHVVAHTLLFAVLAIALARTALRPGSGRWLYAAAVFLAVAASQEAAQALVRGRIVGREELFDLSVDVLGGALGLVLWARSEPALARRIARALGWLLHPGVVAPLGLLAVYTTGLGSGRAALPWCLLAAVAATPVALAWLVGLRTGRYSDADLSVRRERPALLAFGFAWAAIHLGAAYALGAPSVVLTTALCGVAGAAALALVTVAGFKVSAHVSVAVGLAVAAAATSYRAPFLFAMAAALLTWARVRDFRHTPREVAGAWALASGVAGLMFHLRP